MAEANAKVSDFITRTRQAARAYEAWVTQARGLVNEWGALYSTLLFDYQFVGENLDIIPNPSYTQSLTDVIGNMQTILAAFDAGIDTNFERVA